MPDVAAMPNAGRPFAAVHQPMAGRVAQRLGVPCSGMHAMHTAPQAMHTEVYITAGAASMLGYRHAVGLT